MRTSAPESPLLSRHARDGRAARRSLQGLTTLALVLGLTGCHSLLPSPLWPSPDFPPQERIDRLASRVPDRIPLGPEWSASPGRIEEALRQPLEVVAARDVEHGQTRTSRLSVRSATGGLRFEVKWKPARPGLVGINNSPRREIAAYQVQRLVLAEEEYVVPTTTLLCLPPDVAPGAIGEPNVEGVGCVVGAAALWLQEVRYPVRKIDWERFLGDPLYARHAANLNIAAMLMDHSDTHTRNLLVSEDPGHRRMFLIDNGISFGSPFRSPFSRDWNRVRVPALPADAVERLRRLGPGDLRFLGVLAELRPDGEGRWRPIEPGPNLGPDEPVRIRGQVIQLGLTSEEIEALWRRIRGVLELVDSGRVPVL